MLPGRFVSLITMEIQMRLLWIPDEDMTATMESILISLPPAFLFLVRYQTIVLPSAPALVCPLLLPPVHVPFFWNGSCSSLARKVWILHKLKAFLSSVLPDLQIWHFQILNGDMDNWIYFTLLRNYEITKKVFLSFRPILGNKKETLQDFLLQCFSFY